MRSIILAATVAASTALMVAADQPKADKSAHPFNDNVKVTITDEFMIVKSDGIPTHKTGEFPNEHNPNRIQKQDYTFKIPLHPKAVDKPVKLPMGPIGVAVNGVPFYNPYNREGNDAVEGPFAEVFDSCCGHPDQLGRYHYHKYPVCVKSPFHDEKGKHSPLIGYAFDGYAIYGPNGENGEPPTDLDSCNGHTDAQHGYHYHVTSKFPYILGAYHGVPEASNLDHRGNFAGGRGSDGPSDDRPPRDGDRRGRRRRGDGPPPPPPGDGPPPPPPDHP